MNRLKFSKHSSLLILRPQVGVAIDRSTVDSVGAEIINFFIFIQNFYE